jgi:hypothetical protein
MKKKEKRKREKKEEKRKKDCENRIDYPPIVKIDAWWCACGVAARAKYFFLSI